MAMEERFGQYSMSRAIITMGVSPFVHSKRLIYHVVALKRHFKQQIVRDATANVGRNKAKFAHYFLVISDDTALPKYSASSMIKMISAIIK